MQNFSNFREEIIQYIVKYIDIKKQQTKNFSFNTATLEELKKFSTQGKLIRGCLALLSHQMVGGKIHHEALKIAAALEINQSAILIHDDIVDKDTLRRGNISIHYKYQKHGEKLHIQDSVHFGNAMGIFVGDIGFFLGTELLNNLICDTLSKQEIVRMYCQEMQLVGLAQMQDTLHGKSQLEPTEDEIVNLYIHKTGRYSFGLPLVLGAQLVTNQISKELMQFGQLVGIIFQLADDGLSLFGKSLQTGKPEGTDIIRNNKTLHRLYLFETVTSSELKKLKTIFGNSNASNTDISYVRQLLNYYKIPKRIEEKMLQTEIGAKKIISSLTIPNEYKEKLRELITYCKNRNK